jgi:hypothetical protein
VAPAEAARGAGENELGFRITPAAPKDVIPILKKIRTIGVFTVELERR